MNPPSHDELVLCCPVTAIPSAWMPAAGAIPLTEAALLEALAHTPPVWRPRSIAETDPTHKQWIPYGLIREPSGRWACYRRRGTETRLTGSRSVGIGGHINPIDAPSPQAPGSPWRSLLWNGFLRELAEELPAAVPGQTQFLGLIHESNSPVGRVHIGVVFLHTTTTPLPMEPGELAPLEWLPHPSSPNCTDLELWSHLALRLLPTRSHQP
jgi:predicted NUDIX family phosphoesterase